MAQEDDVDTNGTSEVDRQHKYKMVALDMDGTLLGPDHTISDATVEYLRYLHKRGFVVSIATGRSATCTFDAVAQLDLSSVDGGNIPVVCSNGARGVTIVSSSGDDDNRPSAAAETETVRHGGLRLDVAEVFHEPVPVDVAQKMIGVSKRLGTTMQYYTGHDIYAVLGTDRAGGRELVARYGALTNVKQIMCDDGFREAVAKGPPSKMLVLCNTSVIDETTDEIRKSLSDKEAHVIRGSPPWFVEILNPNVCKGNGLKKMAGSLDMDMKDIIAFGDGDNDVEFLRFAGKGIAMKNARNYVKTQADEVCEWTNAEDGVMRKLQQMESAGLLNLT